MTDCDPCVCPMVLLIGLQSVIVVFPDHTHLLFLLTIQIAPSVYKFNEVECNI